MHGQTDIKLTALYERLSRDDELAGDSSSIQTQKILLEEYATKHGFLPFKHYTDDGWSGGNFERPNWNQMIKDIESGKVGTVIVKDMSRVGREYLKTGYFTEIFFPQHDVRFIAISNNIDSNDSNSGEIAPFLNIMNDFYLRDCSRKLSQAYQVKGKAGKPTTNFPIYGYKRDPSDKNKRVIDDEAAAVVRRIFHLAANGYGPDRIATLLRNEKVEAPSYYLNKHGIRVWRKRSESQAYDWSGSGIAEMLKKPEYLGHTVNFRSYKKHYKDEKRFMHPEKDWLIFKNTHEPIIDEATWNLVQEVRKTKHRYNLHGEPHILTGLVYCPDCGKPMHNHRCSKKSSNTELKYERYECSSYNKSMRRSVRLCTTHSISAQVLEEFALEAIHIVSKYAIENPDAFRAKVQEIHSSRQDEVLKETQYRLKRLTDRRDELNMLVRKLYEAYAHGKIPEEQFDHVMASYSKELTDIKPEIAEAEKESARCLEDANRANQFLDVVHRFSDFSELTGEMLHSYVERIYVHAKERAPGSCRQVIDIHFRFIGQFPIPAVDPTPEEVAAQEAAAEENRRKKAIKSHEKYVRWKAKKKARLQAEQSVENKPA